MEGVRKIHYVRLPLELLNMEGKCRAQQKKERSVL